MRAQNEGFLLPDANLTGRDACLVIEDQIAHQVTFSVF